MKLISFFLTVFALLLLSFQMVSAIETTVVDQQDLRGIATTVNVGVLVKRGNTYYPAAHFEPLPEFVDVNQSKIMFSLGKYFQKPVLDGFVFTGFNVRCVKTSNGMFTFEFYPRWNNGSYE